MQRTDRLRIVFVLLLSLVGTAALFLPFTSGVSPWKAVTRYEFLGVVFRLGAPFLGNYCYSVLRCGRSGARCPHSPIAWVQPIDLGGRPEDI